MVLKRFMRLGGQKYFVVRNGDKQPDLIDGLPNNDKGGKYIGFYPETNVITGDWIEHNQTGQRLYIHDTDYDYKGKNQPLQLKGYYWTEAQYERENEKSSDTSFNFYGSVNNAIVGTQQHATLTVQIENLYQEVEKRGGEDKEQLKKMLDVIQAALDRGEVKKGSLRQFSDLLAKHNWIMGPLGTLLVNQLFGA